MNKRQLMRQLDIIRTFAREEGQEKGEVSGQMVFTACEIIADSLLRWRRDVPIEVGLYLYRNDREWPLYLILIRSGDWRLSQDPTCLYGNDKPLHLMEPGWWFGPIPESPKSMFDNGK